MERKQVEKLVGQEVAITSLRGRDGRLPWSANKGKVLAVGVAARDPQGRWNDTGRCVLVSVENWYGHGQAVEVRVQTREIWGTWADWEKARADEKARDERHRAARMEREAEDKEFAESFRRLARRYGFAGDYDSDLRVERRYGDTYSVTVQAGNALYELLKRLEGEDVAAFEAAQER